MQNIYDRIKTNIKIPNNEHINKIISTDYISRIEDFLLHFKYIGVVIAIIILLLMVLLYLFFNRKKNTTPQPTTSIITSSAAIPQMKSYKYYKIDLTKKSLTNQVIIDIEKSLKNNENVITFYGSDDNKQWHIVNV